MARDTVCEYIDLLGKAVGDAKNAISYEEFYDRKSYDSGVANGLQQAFELLEKQVLASFRAGRK